MKQAYKSRAVGAREWTLSVILIIWPIKHSFARCYKLVTYKILLSVMPALFMIIATLLWGASFLFIKLALQDIHATAFLFFRFSMATISMLPGLVLYKIAFKQRAVIQGVKLGLLQVGIMLLQTLGLKTISPSLSGFLTGFSIVFVLAVRFIVRRRIPSFVDIISSLTCLAGLALLTYSYGLSWEPGVLYTLGCAFFVALHTYALDHYLLTSNTMVLTFIQMLTLAVIAGLLSFLLGNIQLPTQAVTWGSIVFCGIFCSSLAFLLQALSQQPLGVFKVSMFLMLEPVFATILSYWVLGETLYTHFYIGAAMILGSIAIINLRLKVI